MTAAQAKKIADLEAELAAAQVALKLSVEVIDGYKARAEKAEAEVERLRHLEGEASPSGVSPSPPPVVVSTPYGKETHLAASEDAPETVCGITLLETWHGGTWALCPGSEPSCKVCYAAARPRAAERPAEAAARKEGSP